MGRNKEDNDSFRVRMNSDKRQYLAGEIIEKGYYFVRDGEKLPSFGRFLEDVADCVKKTNPIDAALNVVYSYRKLRENKMSVNIQRDQWLSEIESPGNSLELCLVEAKAKALDLFIEQLFKTLKSKGFEKDEFLMGLSRYFADQMADEEIVAALEKSATIMNGYTIPYPANPEA